MSDLLDKAIVDAKTLREVATRNAESLIVERYSQQVREAIHAMLEADDEELNNPPDLGGENNNSSSTDSLAPEASPGLPSDMSSPMDSSPSDSSLLGATSAETSVVDSQVPMAAGVNGPAEDEEITLDFSVLGQPEEPVAPESTPNEVPTSVGGETTNAPSMEPNLPVDSAQTLSPETRKEEEPLSEEDLFLEGVDEELLAEIVAAFKVDYEPALDGWLGDNPIEKREYEEGTQAVQAAHEANETTGQEEKEVENEEWLKERFQLQESLKDQAKKLENLTKAFSNSQKEVGELKNNLKQVLHKLNESNVSNAKLLYMNHTLKNSSLNERQKKIFVEQLEKVDSVEQAKVIYETLNLTGITAKPSKLKSLNEVISAPSTTSLFTSQREERKISDPFKDRMKTLAGIK